MVEDDLISEALERFKRTPRGEKPSLLDEFARSGVLLAALEAFAAEYADPRSQYQIASFFSETKLFEERIEPIDVEVVASYYYAVSGGGIESSLVSLSSALGRERRALIITEGECGTDIERNGVPGVSVSSMKRAGETRFDTLSRLLLENNVDVLLHHAWFDARLLWDVVLCKLLGVRVVLNVHGVFSHFLSVTDGTFAPWNDGRLFASVPRVAALCDAVVSQTAVNKRFFRQFNERSYEIGHALPKGLLERSSPTCNADGKNEAVRPGGATMLWVGRFDVYKHPEDAIRVLARVRSLGVDAKLVMVGESGYETYERELEDLAKTLGVSDYVAFEGFQKDVGRYYERASVLLLTSEIEGYCMVLAEACAHGLPIVAYDLPYLPFASCKGIGWVDQGDVEAAAEETASLLKDGCKRGEMGRAARRFVSGEGGIRFEDRWDDVLRDVARGRDRSDESANILDRTMWDTLFYHYIKGAERTHSTLEGLREELDAARAARHRAEEALGSCRREYEGSYSYRLGRALLWLPRFAARLLRCRRA